MAGLELQSNPALGFNFADLMQPGVAGGGLLACKMEGEMGRYCLVQPGVYVCVTVYACMHASMLGPDLMRPGVAGG